MPGLRLRHEAASALLGRNAGMFGFLALATALLLRVADRRLRRIRI